MSRGKRAEPLTTVFVSVCVCVSVVVFVFGGDANAAEAGFEDAGRHEATSLQAEVQVRGQGAALWNLDLDRGLTPSGRPLYAVPTDAQGQMLGAGDLRMRTDLMAVAGRGAYALKGRFDLDGARGSDARGEPRHPSSAESLRVTRAYGEAVLPFGVVFAGRMGGHWGLGLLANGGDCDECTTQDSADRAGIVTPLAGHLWAVAFDLGSRAALDGVDRRDDRAVFGRSVPARTATFAVMNWRDDFTRARRAGAGKTTIEYGALLTHRWAEDARDVRAAGADGWLRVTFPAARLEAEAALLLATIAQPSAIPGFELRDPVLSRQAGAALQSEIGRPSARFAAGLDAGWASGDPAPGMGAFPAGDLPAGRGELDGPQVGARDSRVDNFRFHPDYRVDRILFHEIVGTVTDAVYLRPHARLRVARVGSGAVTARVAVIGSQALHAASTPGGKAPLGVEIDPTLSWDAQRGSVSLEHAVLFPLAGLDNPDAGLDARPAQAVRLRITWRLGT